jgi:hypothetical protein
MRLSPLDQRMNADIDQLIEQLQKAKNTRTYFQRSAAVKQVAKACEDYEFYWTERLYDLMD